MSLQGGARSERAFGGTLVPTGGLEVAQSGQQAVEQGCGDRAGVI